MEGSKKLNIKKNLDVFVAISVIGIILLIVIPVPSQLIDVLVTVNISLAMLIILLTMFTTDVDQISAFPTILLVTTLFRVGLNVSSTRLILRDHYAGQMIEAFGSAVVGDNYVIGIIIFLIIIIIQFKVINEGSGRIAEVAARFTLDAMPGKQMAIDADLNTGLIDENAARERRKKLQREADFYGSMDGATKFVKGDAVAGLIITCINIIGGIVIGVVMNNMDAATAAQTYIKLTVGDGIVSQVPALMISTAAGMLVTRSGSDENFGKLITRQLTGYPKIFAIASVILLFLSLVPSLPRVPFLILSVVLGGCAYLLYKDQKKAIEKKIQTEQQQVIETENKEPENVMELITVEPMEIEIGYGLIPLVDEGSGGDLLERIASVRRQCAIEMGIVVQPIRLRDNLQLKTNEYVIKIRGTAIARWEMMPNMLLCMDPTNGGTEIQGVKTIEPTFGLPAVWINTDQREDAEIKGFTVVDPITVMVTHLTESIKSHSYELLGRQEVKMIIDSVKERYNTVVEELIPDLMTIGEVQKVLQNLLKEKVSIKDMVTILESLADNSRMTKDIELLTEYVRFSLSRTICNPLIDENGAITVVTLDPKIEELIANNIQKSMQGSFPAIDPDSTGKILASIKNITESVYFYENQPVILVSPKIRPAFRKLIEMVYPNVYVLSLNEIPNDIEIKTEGVVTI